jgi:hypothetical protein
VPVVQGGPHHTLRVVRSFSLGYEVLGTTRHQPRRRTFVRFFICPAKSERFQARISLTEMPMSEIESVTVDADNRKDSNE